QEIIGDLIEPVRIFKRDRQRLLPGAEAYTADQQRLERGLAQLGVERESELVLGDRQVEHGAQERSAQRKLRVEQADLAEQCGDPLLSRRRWIELEEILPDRLPGEVAIAGSV